jgi:hypothetical protein
MARMRTAAQVKISKPEARQLKTDAPVYQCILVGCQLPGYQPSSTYVILPLTFSRAIQAMRTVGNWKNPGKQRT